MPVQRRCKFNEFVSMGLDFQITAQVLVLYFLMDIVKQNILHQQNKIKITNKCQPRRSQNRLIP